ncbi:MAG: aminotransferase class V-fold PLP-dependent enzyme [Anaerolineae bacterium]
MTQHTSAVAETVFNLPWPGAGDQFLLRPEVTFLNHGSFGATPRPVFERYQAWQRELEGEPVEFLGRRIRDLLAEARAPLAEYLHTSPDDLVYVPNITFAVNIVARSLDLRPGDEVLATNHEYGASDRTWRFNCAKKGVRYINQPIALPITTADDFVDQLWAGVTERTKVIFISHITSATALIFPVAEVCRRAREAGILTVIDAAHAPGHIDLYLDELDADYYLANCHKWMMSPKGAGFLHAPPAMQALLEPLVVSWGWESEMPSGSDFQDWFGWMGTDDPAPYLSVPAAIEFQCEHNWPLVRQECHRLTAWTRERVAELTGMEHICPEDWFGQMCVLPLPVGTLDKLGTRLWDEYRIEIPQMRWNGREFVRVSIQAYNSQADVEKLIDALKSVLSS